MNARGKVSILIPVYNERFTIERVVHAAALAPLPEGISRELIIVNDGSIDGTPEVLANLKVDVPFQVVNLHNNLGKGAAIRAGIPVATGDWILIQDGDMEYDPSAYEAIVAPLANGTAKVVYGSRFLGSIHNMAWPYRLVNRLLVSWVNFLFGTSITDEATAYKAFETRLIRSLDLQCQRFEFCPEVTGKLCRKSVAIYEVPVRYLGRTKAQGKKIRWHDAIDAFWVLFRERWR